MRKLTYDVIKLGKEHVTILVRDMSKTGFETWNKVYFGFWTVEGNSLSVEDYSIE